MIGNTNDIKQEAFTKFDELFEALECSPYTAAQDYFNGGWNACFEAVNNIFKESQNLSDFVEGLKELV